MTSLLLAAAVLTVSTWVCLSAALMVRGRRFERGAHGHVRVVIPIRWHARLEPYLERFATQQHRDFILVLVTATENEPAVGVARTIASKHSNVRLVVAGNAVACGQKNHNLLAGIASTVGPKPEWLVFTDDDCFPDSPDWLDSFVSAAASSNALATTSFRRVQLPPLPRLGTVLYFYCTAAQRAVMALSQRFTWGGATVLRRSEFERLGLSAFWARTIVDDVSLSQAVREAGGSLSFSKGSMLCEDAPAWSVRDAFAWLVRQFQFLRFHDRLALSAGLIVLWASSLAPLAHALTLVAVAAFVVISGVVHAYSRRRTMIGLGLLVLPLLVPFAATAASVASLSRRVRWGNLAYVVHGDGTVEVSGSST